MCFYQNTGDYDHYPHYIYTWHPYIHSYISLYPSLNSWTGCQRTSKGIFASTHINIKGNQCTRNLCANRKMVESFLCEPKEMIASYTGVIICLTIWFMEIRMESKCTGHRVNIHSRPIKEQANISSFVYIVVL